MVTEKANQDPGWRFVDHCGPTHVDACCTGRDAELPLALKNTKGDTRDRSQTSKLNHTQEQSRFL